MSNVVLITMPHTGTHSVGHALRPCVDSIFWGFGLEKEIGNVLRTEHFFGKERATCIKVMQTANVIYTVRDPLGALISTISRGEAVSYYSAGWLEYSNAVAEHGGMPVCIDLDVKDVQLDAACRMYGLYKMGPLILEVRNSTFPTALTLAYRNGDWDYINSSIPDEIAELKSQEPVLRPWLESYGYLGLMWWS